MLEQGEILTLDDNKKYSVVYVTDYNSKNYAYLVDQEDYLNNMFCEYDDENGLQEVVDPEIVEKLLARFKMSTEK